VAEVGELFRALDVLPMVFFGHLYGAFGPHFLFKRRKRRIIAFIAVD
jgi:hypothetical protein